MTMTHTEYMREWRKKNPERHQLAKCEPVCRNCHVIRTVDRRREEVSAGGSNREGQ